MSLVDWIYPVICVGCGVMGKYICDNCQKKSVAPEQICPMCCRPSLDGWTHTGCRTELGMERLIVGLPYRGVVQQCLKKVKYKSAWGIISFLFDKWQENCGATVPRDTVITSVPMWKQKERARGFNQAEMLGKQMAVSYSVPYLVTLERVRDTQPMFGLDRQKRKENIGGAFKISKQVTANSIQQNRVILVDDVWTTGVTIRECAKTLKKCGAREVWGVTLAR